MSAELSELAVARLRALVHGVDVDHFPDVPERYAWAKTRQTLLVGYEGSTYATPSETLAPSSTTETVELGVTVLVRSLRGPLGAPALIARVRRALFGWRPPTGGGALVPTRSQFVSEDQGVWRFVIVFQSATTVVAEDEPDDFIPGPSAVEADQAVEGKSP